MIGKQARQESNVYEAHKDEAQDNAYRDRNNGDQRASNMQKEKETNQCHDSHLLEERFFQRVDSPKYKRGAVITRDDLNTFREPCLKFTQSFLHPFDDIQRVFQRVYSEDKVDIQGISDEGVGLSIVKSICENLGGRVWVDSEVGSGSVFTILLPLAD